ncbi:MAG: Crp/Fnr family transcriptional regulator [Calditrichaeota bacterium]|nr:Crp/Fnr family transcriptional regulator [Calditrichota bacterium]MCB9367370.1 Crp/Fnr family transcriptional regulator [Calditrichota bacterium]MCB9391336.1 Crp/Fnr family transcriptional regulator [Calditrichota bacterium]
MQLTDILGQFSFFSNASTALQREILAQSQLATLDSGVMVYREGEACTRIAFVGEGSVRVYKRNEGGREITLYHVRSTESCILTTSCALTGQRYPATAAVEPEHPVTAAVISPEYFQNLVNTQQVVRDYVFEMMSRRIVDMMSLIEEITFGKMDHRIAHFLLEKFTGEGTYLRSIHITHEQIADELGTAREVVSRLLKEFERSGAVELGRGRVRMVNEPLLRTFAGESP